jgi:hypothetical protein
MRTCNGTHYLDKMFFLTSNGFSLFPPPFFAPAKQQQQQQQHSAKHTPITICPEKQ